MIARGHFGHSSRCCIGAALILPFSGQAWVIPLLFVLLDFVYIHGLHVRAANHFSFLTNTTHALHAFGR